MVGVLARALPSEENDYGGGHEEIRSAERGQVLIYIRTVYST